MIEVKQRVAAYKNEILQDLKSLIAIPSIRDLTTREKGAPFGKDIKEAFNTFLLMGERCGFDVEDFDGYAIHIQYGKKTDYVGALGHLDVVSSGDYALWNSDPFLLTQKCDMLFGRGVNDDKGPLLAAFYAMRVVKDMNIPLKHSIRIIAGGAEETTWECMKHYFTQNEQPLMGFSPDGNFPIVNGEKGIMQYSVGFLNQKEKNHNVLIDIFCEEEKNFVCDSLIIQINKIKESEVVPYISLAEEYKIDNDSIRIVYKGERSLSRNPQRGENALWKVAKDLSEFPFSQSGMNQLLQYLLTNYTDDFYGKKAGIFFEDSEMGMTSICPMSIIKDSHHFLLNIDYRYPKGVDKDQVLEWIRQRARDYQGSISVFHEKPLLFISEESNLIVSLKKAYQIVMNEEATVLTKGGASYARTLTNGVAFGATFEGEDPKPHMPNEQMPLSSLLKACEIYVYTFIELAGR